MSIYSDTDFNSLFYFDSTCPGGLRWKVDRYKGLKHAQKFISSGDAAGTLNTMGYYQVGLYGKSLLTHKILFCMYHGKDVDHGYEIDHFNRDKTDNSQDNLRQVTRTFNQRNKGKSTNNTSGTTGVVLSTVYCKGAAYNYYIAQCRGVDGKVTTKNFSIKKLGLLPAYAYACRFREKFLSDMIDLDGSYALSHGK